MKNMKLMLALAILVFATTAGFSQQTKKSETNGKADRLSRKEAHRGKPEAVARMQEEREIGQARSERGKEKKADKDGVKKGRKLQKKNWKKGQKPAADSTDDSNSQKYNKRQKQRPSEVKTIPHKDGRYPQKEDKVMRPDKKEEGVAPTKRRSRKGQ